MKLIHGKSLMSIMMILVSFFLVDSMAFAHDDDDHHWRHGHHRHGWYAPSPVYIPAQPVYAMPPPVYVAPPVTYVQPQPPPVVFEVPGVRVEIPLANGYYRQW